MIQVCGDRVLSESRLQKKKRKGDQRKQELKGVERVEKNARES